MTPAVVLRASATTALAPSAPSAASAAEFRLFSVLVGTSLGAPPTVVDVGLHQIAQISVPRLKVDASAVAAGDAVAITTCAALLEKAKDAFQALHPNTDLRMMDIDAVDMYVKRGKLVKAMTDSKCMRCPRQNEQVFPSLSPFLRLSSVIQPHETVIVFPILTESGFTVSGDGVPRHAAAQAGGAQAPAERRGATVAAGLQEPHDGAASTAVH